MEQTVVQHTLPPVFDARSRVLILGTMPSPRSRAAGFYYMHPQNRFWTVLAQVLGQEIPPDAAGRTAFLLAHHIALWDVLASCRITGAQDASIRDPVANDIPRLLAAAPIGAVFATGKTAAKYYDRLLTAKTSMPIHTLPSPSPANCAVPLARMLQEYAQILPFLRQG